ncbi:MAG: radical SAM/SPASM domain-containing protein [Sandaracinaceae bacterium]|nr:radical SAM/SPASM domain-containing protein [Sandaracinaceae bacterium]
MPSVRLPVLDGDPSAPLRPEEPPAATLGPAPRPGPVARARHRLQHVARDAQTVVGMYSKRFAPVGPRILQLAVPAPCDHNCSFCITPFDLPDGRNETNKRFDYASTLQLIDDAVELRTLRFNICSWGETLLFPRIKELIAHIQARSEGAAVIKIVTHGARIEDAGVDFFIDHGVSFWVSLHAGDFETWERIHQPGGTDPRARFESMRRSVRRLAASGRNEVTLHNVVCDQNHDRLGGVLDFAREVGVTRVNFGMVRSDEGRFLEPAQRLALRAELPSLIARADALSLHHNLHSFAFELGEGAGDAPKHWSPDGDGFYNENRCYIGWLMTFVNLEGDVMPCCRGAAVGNVQGDRFRDIWHEGYADFRSWSVDLPGHTPRPGYDCESCSHVTLNDRARRLVRR